MHSLLLGFSPALSFRKPPPLSLPGPCQFFWACLSHSVTTFLCDGSPNTSFPFGLCDLCGNNPHTIGACVCWGLAQGWHMRVPHRNSLRHIDGQLATNRFWKRGWHELSLLRVPGSGHVLAPNSGSHRWPYLNSVGHETKQKLVIIGEMLVRKKGTERG